MSDFFTKSDLSRKDAENIVSDTLNKCDDGELYLENSKSESILLDDNKIKSSIYNSDLGYGLRAVTGEVVAYSHSNEISKNSLKKSAENLNSTLKSKDGIYNNEILKKGIDKLKPLYENFFFDKREKVAKDLRTISKPVFNFVNDKLSCRFLKDYITTGHKIENVSLSISQKLSLNLIKNISEDSKNSLSYNLETNDMVFSDNHRLFHGRTAFKDLDGSSKKREFLRVWIKTNLD